MIIFQETRKYQPELIGPPNSQAIQKLGSLLIKLYISCTQYLIALIINTISLPNSDRTGLRSTFNIEELDLR